MEIDDVSASCIAGEANKGTGLKTRAEAGMVVVVERAQAVELVAAYLPTLDLTCLVDQGIGQPAGVITWSARGVPTRLGRSLLSGPPCHDSPPKAQRIGSQDDVKSPVSDWAAHSSRFGIAASMFLMENPLSMSGA